MAVTQSSGAKSSTDTDCSEPYSERFVARCLAAGFALYGLTATALLGINMPPFQIADEFAHFSRAAQLASGRLVGTRFSQIGTDGLPHVVAGDLMDPALLSALEPFRSMPFHPEVKITQADLALNVLWSDTRVMQRFSSTIIYPPFFYIPSAIGVLAGRKAHLSVVRTLMLSRLLTGVTAVAIGTLAIALSGTTAPWIFTILTLPMSLSLMASASQDALLIACCALAGALLVQVLRWSSARSNLLLIGLVVTLSLAAMARPPYGVLATLPLALTKIRLRWRILAVFAVATSVLAWSSIAASTIFVHFSAGVGADPAIQLARLRADPLLAVHVAWETAIQNSAMYIVSFVGVLGWLDTPLPHGYYAAAGAMLSIAVLAVMLGQKGRQPSGGSLVLMGTAIVLAIVATFAIQYLNWTVPGHNTVDGVAGRYFIPLALASSAMLPVLGNARTASFRNALLFFVITFPAVSLAVAVRAVVLRYYLS